jgi:L-fucose isomerase-like protein
MAGILTIDYLPLASPLHDPQRLRRTAVPFLRRLEREGNFILRPAGKERPPSLVFVQSGGTETLFRKVYSRLPQPIFLLSHPSENSLPASLEMLAFVREQGGRGILLHGEAGELARELSVYAKVGAARSRLRAARLGVVGAPSDWLIASRVDAAAVKKRWGCSLVPLTLRELLQESGRAGRTAKTGTQEMAFGNRKVLGEAVSFYRGLQSLARIHRLDGLTLRCFDLLGLTGNTGCLALAHLNDEGIPAACEGDVPALFSMMIGYLLTGSPVFMANPSSVDRARNEMVLAHCTVPFRLVRRPRLMTHFESGKGVAIRGVLPRGPCAVFRFGGRDLSRAFVARGEILGNLRRGDLCRTQARVRFGEDIGKYLRSPLGNHLLLVPGEAAGTIKAFAEMYLD